MSQKILLIEQPTTTVNDVAVNLNFSVLPHPKSANIMFLLQNEMIYEFQSFEPRTFASWFIDQKVSSSESLYLATRIDPRFLVLPFIMKALKYSPIEQLITHTPGCGRIPITTIKSWKMSDMCDVNDKFEDEIYYRYNEEKVLSWLLTKVMRTAKVLYAKRQQRMQSADNKAFTKGFNKSGANASAVPVTTVSTAVAEYETEDLKQSVQLICDYVPDSIASILMQHLQKVGLLAAEGEGSGKDALPDSSVDVPAVKRKAWETDLEVK